MRRLVTVAVVISVTLAACTSDDKGGTGSNSSASVHRRAVSSSVPPTTVDDDGDVANPAVTEVTGGSGQAAGGFRYDVTQYGYAEKEYFFGGTAKTYAPSDLPPAPYRSRMIVWTPADPARFNGTTVVEWAEVSDFGQFELTVELNYQAPMLEREGFAFVLVSAEQRGICDLRDNACIGTSLKGADPKRYGSLDHPGDNYSFDIFNQALQAIKHPTGIAPLGELDSRILIAEGFQASADKWFPVGAPVTPPSPSSPFGVYGPLNAYIQNGADAEARLADAFLIDAGASALEPAHYRVPTLHHLDEASIRRTPTKDSANHVTWEVIGAPHADRWAGDHTRLPSSTPKAGLTRQEEEARRDAADNFGQDLDPPVKLCFPGPKTGDMFPRRFTVNAALLALREWVQTGVAAPSAPRAERTARPPDAATKKLTRDPDGNAIGGLRSPIVEVPVASYNGEGCIAAGTMKSFTPKRLAQLYPTHKTYVQKLLAATDRAVTRRFLVCEDAETIMRKASASTIGGTDMFAAIPRCAKGSGT